MRGVAIIVFAVVAAAAPQVSYPLNSQIPPVAYVGEFFAFQFAQITFQPNPDILQYSIIGNPSWLSLDGSNRTLWGTPSPSDIGSPSFTIIAAGSAGASANMNASLVVKAPGIPSVNGNITGALSGAGRLSGSTSINLLPSKPIDLKFPSDTFLDAGQNLSYYATLADHTPLPSWLSFDPNSLHFTGNTPALSSSPQNFDILLIASDVPNFAQASVAFTLVVSNHMFTFNSVEQSFNASKGNAISFTSLRAQLTLDGASVTDDQIQSATAQLPSWLSFDSRTFAITGTPPSGLMSQDVVVSVEDRFGDNANTTIHFFFTSPLFAGAIEQLNVTAGQGFSYVVPSTILAKGDESVSIDFGNLDQWLKFNSSTLKIQGTIPKDTPTQAVEATLTAKSQDGSSDSQTFEIYVAAPGTLVAGATTGSSSTASSTAVIAKSKDEQAASQSNSKRTAILIGSLVPAIILLVIALALAVLFCRVRRNKKKSYQSPRMEISRPIMQSDEWEDVDRGLGQDLEKGPDDEEKVGRTPEHPPQLDLSLPLPTKTSKHTKNLSATSIGVREANILNEFDHSSWGLRDAPSHDPHDSMKIPTEMARQSSQVSGASNSPSKRRRRTTTIHRDSYRSHGVPVNRRLTGLGHGRHMYSPSRVSSLSMRRRPRDCVSFSSYSTQSTSLLSTAPSALAQTPNARHTTQLTTPFEKRRSIRVVSACDSLLDRRTLDEKRQSYIRKRASAQSPFFGAASSRASSSSYKPALVADASPSRLDPATTCTRVSIITPDDKFSQPKETAGAVGPSSSCGPLVMTSPNKEFPGSLRKPATYRAWAHHSNTTPDRVHKRYERPRALSYSRPFNDRSNSGGTLTLKGHSAKGSVGSMRGSKIFEDAEMSESVYSDGSSEGELEKKENTATKQSPFILPLRLNSLRKGKRESKRTSKQPTRYSLALEHGGKENRKSTHNLAPVWKDKGKEKASTPNISPERHTHTHPYVRPTFQPRSPLRMTAQPTLNRLSQNRSPTRRLSHRSHHSHRSSLSHQSRTGRTKTRTTSHKRERSRTQSSAYPRFETPSNPESTKSHHRHHRHHHRHTHSHTPSKQSSLSTVRTQSSILPRDGSGNILDYGVSEDPTIYEIDDSNVGFHTSNGQITPQARQSRLGALAEQRMASRRTSRASSSMTPTTSSQPALHQLPTTPSPVIALGISGNSKPRPSYFPALLGGSFGHTEETPAPSSTGKGKQADSRTPLGVVTGANGSSPIRTPAKARLMEGKGKSPVSVEVEERVGSSVRGRRTWGSLKAVMRGVGSEAFL